MRYQPRSHHSLLALLPLLLAALACRPVFAVGWSEILLLVLIISVLLGPLLVRIYRFWAAYRDRERKN